LSCVWLYRAKKQYDKNYKEFVNASPGIYVDDSGITYGRGIGFPDMPEPQASRPNRLPEAEATKLKILLLMIAAIGIIILISTEASKNTLDDGVLASHVNFSFSKCQDGLAQLEARY
jgi:hypothetical protein